MAYPLSAKTFIRIIGGKPHFGIVADGLNPFLPQNPENEGITLYLLPQFYTDQHYGRVRHSRVTRKAYVFEIHERDGSIICYPARPPTSGAEY